MAVLQDIMRPSPGAELVRWPRVATCHMLGLARARGYLTRPGCSQHKARCPGPWSRGTGTRPRQHVSHSGTWARVACHTGHWRFKRSLKLYNQKKASTRAFSWLKAATTAFTFKTLQRHYANPQYVDIRDRRGSQMEQVGWLLSCLNRNFNVTVC